MSTPVRKADMRPLYRWILWILGILLVLLIIVQIIISFFADDYVANRLKKSIRQGSDSTYTLTFNDLDLNIFGGSLTIQKARLKVDTTAFSRHLPRPPKSLYRGTVGTLKIGGIHIISALWGDALTIGHITIGRPNIQILKNPHHVPPDTSHHFSSIDSSIYAAITPRYKSLSIDHFTIKKGVIHQIRTGDTLSSVKSLTVELQNIRVDSASAKSGRLFVTHHFAVDAGPFMINLADSLNRVQVKHVAMRSNRKSITIDSMQLIPRYPRYTYARKKGTQIDRINLKIPSMQLHDVDFDTLVNTGRFHSRFVEINHATLKDFHNKNLPFPTHHHPPLPQNAFRKLNQKINIDSLKIKDAYISYSEYDDPAPKAGTVTFENLQATLHNITNYTKAIQAGEAITMDARTNVMGKGRLTTHFEFPLDTKNGFHRLSGTLGPMKFTDFNRILKYVAFAQADAGTLHSMKFKMTLNNTESSGNVIMNYENLKISVLDKKTLKQKGILKNIESFAANKFIVDKNNTPESGMRAGTVHFKRIQKKGVFNYWWKSLFSGMKNSIKK